MAVYYKFKSAKDYDSVAIDGHFISVGHLKEKIFELKHLGRGTDFDLVVTNAQTNEEFLDEGMLIPKNTSVLIRRVPGRPRKPIITAPVTEQEEPNVETISDDVQAVKGSFAGVDPSAMKYADEFEWDEFGNDLYAIPETVPVHSSIPVQDTPVSKEDEESKIKALIDTPALDWQRQSSDGFGPGRGFGRSMGGRMMGGRGFGDSSGRGGFEKKTPPQGYICHRCKVPGHFIQHCPTNGDPNFDVRRVKPPTGIPKSMLMATPDGLAAFEKEIEGMPSTRSVGDLPPELHCPLCKEVMKDAVLTSNSIYSVLLYFMGTWGGVCGIGIRGHIISKSMCVCGATNILADDLLPNKTLRDTINRILESNNNSAENGGSAIQVQDMESRNPQVKVPSPTQSAASKGQHVPAPPPQRNETPQIADTVEEYRFSNLPLIQEKGRTIEVPDVSEATTVKEVASRGTAPLADEEVQQKPISGEAGKKKKKKKIRMPPGAADMQWRTAQDLAPENYMMPFGPSAFNPYWNGIQPGLDGFMTPYGGPMSYMGYGNPMDVAFGGLPHDPFGGPGCMLPYGPPQPQRDLAELAMGFNAGPLIMSREEFEAHKADLKRKREMERCEERQMSKDGEYGREGSSTGYVSSISKFRSTPPPSDHHLTYRLRFGRHSPDRHSRDLELPRPSSKKKSDQELDHHHQHSRENHDDIQKHRDHHRRSNSHQRRSESPSEPVAAASQPLSIADKKPKASVFSRISFPENDSSAPKKRKLSSEVPAAGSSCHRATSLSNGHHEEHKVGLGSRKSGAPITAPSVDHDSSDDEKHFKRRPSRYNSSPPPVARCTRERERECYSKHR
ncbi:protein mpe1 [Phtheirospermum japonicum]|uniref:Protein mpe1 n=1 Tax=Phtheirospermum japonicum TaxID=374723 RepID=A0A830BI37_9LAMI|nr:protein mpe1 [Phtheirospermum japonicum]